MTNTRQFNEISYKSMIYFSNFSNEKYIKRRRISFLSLAILGKRVSRDDYLQFRVLIGNINGARRILKRDQII